MSISFACGCGQALSVPDAYAGQTVRCTSCSAPLSVPRPDAAPAPVATTSAGPPRRAPLRPVVLAGLALFLLAAGAVAVIWLLRRPTVSADFDLVPRDAQGFLTVRVADLLETAAGRKVRESLGNEFDHWFRRNFGVPHDEVERLTMVVVNGSRRLEWYLIHTRADYSRKNVGNALASNFRWEHDGKTIWKARDGTSLHFATDTLYIVAPNEVSMVHCLDLTAKPGAGPLNDALKRASQNNEHVVGAINLDAPGARDNVLQELELIEDPFVGGLLKRFAAHLVRARMGDVAIVADDRLRLSATGEYHSADDADRARTGLESLQLFLPGKLEVSREGSSLSAILDIDPAKLGRLLRSLGQ